MSKNKILIQNKKFFSFILLLVQELLIYMLIQYLFPVQIYIFQQGIPAAIATAVLGDLNLRTVFNELDGHMTDSAADENHVYSLIKTIVKYYCKVRLHHLGKENTQDMSWPTIRKKLSKLVLFRHQW